MFKSYLTIVFRHFVRDKSYVLINVLGLALAISCGVILLAYVNDELSYDQHFANHERIFRIVFEHTANGNTKRYAVAPMALAPLFQRAYPDLIESVRIGGKGTKPALYTVGDVRMYQDDVRSADSNIFEMFTHQAVYGDLEGALDDPESIAINESFARSLFGERNPVGETVSTSTIGDLKVSVVFADLPDNTHMKYRALFPWKLMKQWGRDDDLARPDMLFDVFDTNTYFMIKSDFTERELQRALDDFYETYAADIGKERKQTGRYLTQRLKDVHLDNSWEFDEPSGNVFYVYGFISVAVFILLIAIINYTNLATARAVSREKEVSIRKIIGARRSQLAMQFIGESVWYAAVSLVVASILIVLVGQYTPMNEWFGKSDLLNLQPAMLGGIVLGALTVALLAGIYPALYLSAIAPLMSSTTNVSGRKPNWVLRQGLVFVQFFVSVGVVSATLIMGSQMHYVATKSTGYNDALKVGVLLRSIDTIEKIPVIKNELMKNANVLGVTKANYRPGRRMGFNVVDIENESGGMEATAVNGIYVDEDFVDVMGIEIIAGRNLSSELQTDAELSVLVNETLAKMLGWDHPIGKRFPGHNARVIGVTKDFHLMSLHQPVAPTVLVYQPEDFSQVADNLRHVISRDIVISISHDNVTETISYIDSVLSEIDKIHPVDYVFFRDLFDDMYQDENNLVMLIAILAGICIFVSSMGLYGLAAFLTVQRTKEIGVRKVLGASTSQIIFLLTRNIIVLVVSASILGSLLSYNVMDDWLKIFAYRVEIEFWMFLVASVVMAGIALSTVALQSFAAARANPVDAIHDN